MNTFYRGLAGCSLLAFTLGVSTAQGQNAEDFDQYKLRVDTDWFHVDPSGVLRSSTNGTNDVNNPIDLKRDLAFGSYSTFSGKVDWHFKRKMHLYVEVAPFNTSRQRVLDRSFTFQGQTFHAGATTATSLNTFYVAPGFQYDFIRRKRGHLGLAAQFDLFHTTAKLEAAGQVTGSGEQQGAVSAKGSLNSPIPVLGPEFRYYLTKTPKLFVEGNLMGMYLFGYGNFVSSGGSVGFNLSRHFAATAGYTLASHLTVNTSRDRIGLQVSDKGAIVGLQTSF